MFTNYFIFNHLFHNYIIICTKSRDIKVNFASINFGLVRLTCKGLLIEADVVALCAVNI